MSPPIPSSPLLPAAPVAAPGILSSPLERRVGWVPALLFLSSLGAVVYLVRVGLLPPWSLAGLALWVAPSALFQEVASSVGLAAVSQLLAAHHQALALLVLRLAESAPRPSPAPAEPSSGAAPVSPSTPIQVPPPPTTKPDLPPSP